MNLKHNFMFNNVFPENGVVYEVVWKKLVETERSLVAIQYGAEKRDWHAG